MAVLANRPALVLVTGPPGTGKSSVAELVASLMGAAVLSHDWTMSGLRPFPEIQEVLNTTTGHRAVGWSIMTRLAQQQLRAGRSVVLDGVARHEEVSHCRATARCEGARSAVVATSCSDSDLHRSRIEGRERRIPDWYELDWEHVRRSLATWERPDRPEIEIDAAQPWEEIVALLRTWVESWSPAA